MTEATAFAEILKEFETRLHKRQTPGEVGLLFGDLLTDWFEFVLLFNVKGTLAYGWKTFSATGKVSRLDNLVVPLDTPSPFSRALRSGVPVGGVSTGLPEWRAILEMRGLKPPRPFVAIPVTVAGRVPVLVYVDSNNRPSPSRLSKLTQLSALAGWRIEEIILERKQKADEKDSLEGESSPVLETEREGSETPPPLPDMEKESLSREASMETEVEKNNDVRRSILPMNEADLEESEPSATSPAKTVSIAGGSKEKEDPMQELQTLLQEDWVLLYAEQRSKFPQEKPTSAPRLDIPGKNTGKTGTSTKASSETAAPPSSEESWNPVIFDSKEADDEETDKTQQ